VQLYLQQLSATQSNIGAVSHDAPISMRIASTYVPRSNWTSPPVRTTIAGGLAPWQLRRAKEMFLADMSERLPLRRVAAACRLSVSHFGSAFKASTGVPPHQWRIKARIERALALLMEATIPLADVAGACGFADQSHFSRVFVRTMGTTPGAWRRKYRACRNDPSDRNSATSCPCAIGLL